MSLLMSGFTGQLVVSLVFNISVLVAPDCMNNVSNCLWLSIKIVQDYTLVTNICGECVLYYNYSRGNSSSPFNVTKHCFLLQ